MLTGRAPFLADSPMATMNKGVNEEPPRLRSSHSTTPKDLETICLKCLEKDPTRRYSTARALAEGRGVKRRSARIVRAARSSRRVADRPLPRSGAKVHPRNGSATTRATLSPAVVRKVSSAPI